MKQYQLLFDNNIGIEEKFLELKKECDSYSHGDITFYITWMNDAKENADCVMDAIGKTFPSSICYGNESSGNINNGSIVYGVNVTCYVFEKQTTKTELVWVEKGTNLQTLDDLWAYCRTKKDLRAVELISTIDYLNVLEIDGYNADLDKNVRVFGGVACNYFDFKILSEILATGHPRTTTGMAAVLYCGTEITFDSYTVLGWKSLGKKMKVTSSDEKCISEINNMPAFGIYKHYFGSDIAAKDSLVFPLMITEGKNEFIRTPMSVNPDDTMLMFAKIPVGTDCSIAYGDKDTILTSITERAHSIAGFQPQVLKAFSCVGRRLFWTDGEVSKETDILQKIVPVSGYYTGGEIIRMDDKIRVLNHTLCVTGISENVINKKESSVVLDEIDKSIVARITHFNEMVAKEEADEKQKLMQDMAIIQGLASEYTTLYFVNLDTGDFTVYADTGLTEEMKKAVSGIKKYKDFFNYFMESKSVHPDSVEDFSKFFTKEKENIRNKKSATLLFKRKYGDEYLWTKAVAVKCEEVNEEPHHAVLGFVECDNEVRKEETVHKFTDVLEKGLSPDDSINNILSNMADYYKADSAYVIETRNAGKEIRKTYGWFHDKLEINGESKLIDSHIDLEKWVEAFKAKGYIYAEYLDLAPGKSKKYFEDNNIQNMLMVPMTSEGEIIGFVEIDNPEKAIKDTRIINIASAVIISEITRRKENDEEHITLSKLTDAFVSVLYVNLENDSMHPWRVSDQESSFYYENTTYSNMIREYCNNFITGIDYTRCLELASPENVIKQFKNSDNFYLEVIDNRIGYDRNLVFDFLRVTEDGKQFVLCCRDVSDTVAKQKEHQAQLQEALEMAKSADKAKTEFLFNMSHDIRTPMNAILGFTDMAIRHFDEEDRAMDSLLKIKSSGGHLLNLINDILEMSRIESGKFELGETPVDIREAVKNIENMTQSLATPKSIDYKVIMDEIKNPYVYADELHINEVIVNLISNSIKYTNEDGKVRYTINQLTDIEDGKVWFRFDVSDNGIGMSDEFQKHLFEAFSREKSSTVSKIQGAGLGLSIVKRIVDLAGGKITVNSKLGEGSSFIVDLPFRVMDQEAIDKFAPEQEHKHDADIKEDIVLEGRRVLLVEDNEMNREIADEILTEVGLVIETAENGQIAVDMVSDKGINYYDFVLMDIQMPVLDGYGATAAIRNLPDGDKLTIIALSANAFDEDKKKSVSMGMNAHVAKPIDVKELFAVMHDLA